MLEAACTVQVCFSVCVHLLFSVKIDAAKNNTGGEKILPLNVHTTWRHKSYVDMFLIEIPAHLALFRLDVSLHLFRYDGYEYLSHLYAKEDRQAGVAALQHRLN